MKIGPKPDIPPAVAPASTAGAGASSAAASAQSSPAAAQATAQSAQAAQAQSAQKSAAAAASAGVPVTVSSLTRSLEESGANGSFDTKKVESMRTAIANGTYKVDPEAIADKLLSNARQVLRKSQV